MEIELCRAADAVVAVGTRLQQKYGRSLLNVKVEIITPGIVESFSSEWTESKIHWMLNAYKSNTFLKKFNVFVFD